MISKNSYFDLILGTLRRNIWALSISGVLGFLVLPLPVIMAIQMTLSRVGLHIQQEMDAHKELAESMMMYLQTQNVMVKIMLTALAVLVSISFFSYTHSKVKVDFYHSIPVSRTKLFTVNYTSGILAVIPIYIVNLMITLAIIFAYNVGSQLVMAQIMLSMLGNIVFFTVIYTIGIICALLCGHTFVSVMLFLFVSVCGPLYMFVLNAVADRFYETFLMSEDFIYGASKNLSPVVRYLFDDGLSGKIIFVYAVISAIAVFLALIIYKIKSSESASNAVSFRGIKFPLKYIIVTLGTLTSSLILYSVTDLFAWAIIGGAIGAFLCHFIVEVIYDFDMRAVSKNLIPVAIFFAIFTVCITGMRYDITGFDKRLPERENISSVSIDFANGQNRFVMNNYDYNQRMQIQFVSPSIINVAYGIAQNGIANIDTKHKYDGDAYVHFTRVIFSTKHGLKFARKYPVVDAKVYNELVQSVINTDEFMQKANPLFSVTINDAHSIKHIFINDVNSGIDYKQEGFQKLSGDEAYRFDLINILRQEWQAVDPETLRNTAPIITLTVEIGRADATADEVNYEYSLYGRFDDRNTIFTIPVYETFTKTIDVIERSGYKFGGLDLDAIDGVEVLKFVKPEDAKEIRVQHTEKAEIYREDTKLLEQIQSFYVTDKNVIKELMDGAILFDLIGYSAPQFAIDRVYRLRVNTYTEDNYMQSSEFVYALGQAPYELIDSLIKNKGTNPQQ